MQIYPLNYPATLEYHGHLIEYKNFIEICQGGPEVGRLWIDGFEIKNSLFGGPALFYDEYFVAPVLVARFIGRVFQLAMVNLMNREIIPVGKRRNLILLSRIEDNRVFFFVDLKNSKQEFLDLPKLMRNPKLK